MGHSPTPQCSSYCKGSFQTTLNYSQPTYFIYIYIYIYIYNQWWFWGLGFADSGQIAILSSLTILKQLKNSLIASHLSLSLVGLIILTWTFMNNYFNSLIFIVRGILKASFLIVTTPRCKEGALAKRECLLPACVFGYFLVKGKR